MSETASAGKRKAEEDDASSPPGRRSKGSLKDPLPESSRKKKKKKKKNRVLVEFLFRSYPTHLLEEGDLEGTIHIKLVQDPITGLYSVPMGRTPFRATLDEDSRDVEGWCGGEGHYNGFNGSLERTSDGRIEIHSGLSLCYYAFEDREVHASVVPHHCGDYPDGARWMNTIDFDSATDMKGWEREQGGLLKFGARAVLSWIENDSEDGSEDDSEAGYNGYDSGNENYRRAEATYKVKLYTVLSAHKPGETALPEYREGATPDWDALVRVVASRRPDKGESWARNAVRQYRYFLELKLDPSLEDNDFSPSKALDEIWHAHLSLVDRYQKDLVCLTNEGILEHKPVHVTDSYRYYQQAYKEHSKRMADKGTAVDKEFWPTPNPNLFPQERTYGDDDHLDTGVSGCGGCG